MGSRDKHLSWFAKIEDIWLMFAVVQMQYWTRVKSGAKFRLWEAFAQDVRLPLIPNAIALLAKTRAGE